jgi:molecular chaperone DnaK
MERARQAAQTAAELDEHNTDTEVAQEAREGVFEARKLLADVRKDNLAEIRQLDLNRVVSLFNDYVREYARQSECTSFDALVKTAEGCITEPTHAFDHHLDELRAKNFEILWRQDWFVIERFKGMVGSPHLYSDRQRFEELSALGSQLVKQNQIDQLRQVVGQLYSIMVGGADEIDMSGLTNILKG